MDLETRHVRAFVSVVDEETFTDAAIALGTTQASVSRSVQRLEQLVGAALLTRSSRLVELTETGRRVLPQARRLLTVLDQLADAGRHTADIRVGFAWSALGEHTIGLQREWEQRGQGALVFVQSNTPTSGLLEGRAEVAVVRRPVTDARLGQILVGTEQRYAVMSSDHPLVAQGQITMADFTGLIVASDPASGSTTPQLWPADAQPGRWWPTQGVDEWLTVISSGRVLGLTSAATVIQNPRPGITYRRVEDAPPIEVTMIWWREHPPPVLEDLVETIRAAFRSAEPD